MPEEGRNSYLAFVDSELFRRRATARKRMSMRTVASMETENGARIICRSMRADRPMPEGAAQ